MTGKFVLIFVFIFNTTSYAGDGKRIISFFNIGASYQLNNADVSNKTHLQNALTTDNTFGWQAGLELFWKLPKHLFFATGADFRTASQKLFIKYDTQEAGFTGQQSIYNEEITYTNYYIAPHARFGYSFPVGGNAIDFSVGLSTYIPTSGKRNDEKDITVLYITSNEYTDLAMYTDERWGHNSDYGFLPLKTVATLQLSYRIQLGKANLRLGADFNSGNSSNMNRTTINYFGPERTDIGQSVFSDRFQSAGLFVSVGL